MAQTLISFYLFTFYQIDKILCKSTVLLNKALCPAWSTHQFSAVFSFPLVPSSWNWDTSKGSKGSHISDTVSSESCELLAQVHVALYVRLKKKKCLDADAVVVSFQLNRNHLIAALAVATVDASSSVLLTWRSQIRSLCRWPIKWTSWSMIQCICAVFVDYPPQTNNLSSQSRSIY